MLASAQVDRNLLRDAGALLSDLPLQLRISWEQRVAQQHHKESHELCEGFVWDYRVVLTRHVAEVVCSLIPEQCPKLPTWARTLVRLYYCPLCLQNTTNGGLSRPTCLIVTAFLSPTLQTGTQNFSNRDLTLAFIWAQNGVKARLSWRLQHVAGMWAKHYAAIIQGKSQVYF